MAAKSFGVGLCCFAGESHEERQRRQAKDDGGENEEGILIAEHRRLAQHLLVSLSDGHLGGVGRRYSLGHHHFFHAIHIKLIRNASANHMGGEIGLVDLRAAGEVRSEQSCAGAAAEITSEVGERRDLVRLAQRDADVVECADRNEDER